VKEATPLSRFLLEVAATDCDLDTAEGRARMASQAQPLWTAMPDGALKRQLLGELADGVGLDARELAQLWQAHPSKAQRGAKPPAAGNDTAPPAYPEPSHYSGEPETRKKRWTPRPTQSWRRPSTRGLLGRADRVARIVLTNAQAWDWLSADDHHLLGHEPPPHGPLFAWLETQWHEHGPQPWAALREALRDQPFEALAVELNASGVALERPNEEDASPESGPPTEDELRRELGELLRRMHIENLKHRETELIAQAGSDPEAMRLYKEVHEQRKVLEAGN